MQPFVWESRIRFVDTDASGRIHYTALMRHFEAAEFEFLRAIGCPYSSFRREEGGFPRVHVEADYLSALRCEDVISTQVTVERVGATSYTLAFFVTTDGRVAAKGKIAVVCMDHQTQRPKPLPERFSEALQKFI
jgi:YbgC/YbaW family acyl-CoA thioester hydrolase